jgi:hypothetical protein
LCTARERWDGTTPIPHQRTDHPRRSHTDPERERGDGDRRIHTKREREEIETHTHTHSPRGDRHTQKREGDGDRHAPKREEMDRDGERHTHPQRKTHSPSQERGKGQTHTQERGDVTKQEREEVEILTKRRWRHKKREGDGKPYTKYTKERGNGQTHTPGREEMETHIYPEREEMDRHTLKEETLSPRGDGDTPKERRTIIVIPRGDGPIHTKERRRWKTIHPRERRWRQTHTHPEREEMGRHTHLPRKRGHGQTHTEETLSPRRGDADTPKERRRCFSLSVVTGQPDDGQHERLTSKVYTRRKNRHTWTQTILFFQDSFQHFQDFQDQV